MDCCIRGSHVLIMQSRQENLAEPSTHKSVDGEGMWAEGVLVSNFQQDWPDYSTGSDNCISRPDSHDRLSLRSRIGCS